MKVKTGLRPRSPLLRNPVPALRLSEGEKEEIELEAGRSSRDLTGKESPLALGLEEYMLKPGRLLKEEFNQKQEFHQADLSLTGLDLRFPPWDWG